MNRRAFLRALVAAAGGLAGAGRVTPPASAGALPTRPLGSTGATTTILGLGGHHLGLAGSESKARALVDCALEEGIRFFDNAESYHAGTSERWMGRALAGVRKDVFLMTKTHAPRSRSAESARRHLEGSLERLRTDVLDLWQLHSIKTPEDVDRAFAPGGAMEYILEMKAQGVVRTTGVTGHARPDAHLRALHHYDRGIVFDAMQLPVNPVDHHQMSFQRAVLPELKRRGIGVIAMKTSASGRLVGEGLCTIGECLRFVWSLPVDTAVVGMETPEMVRGAAALARSSPMSAQDRAALLKRLEPHADLSLEWYKRSGRG